MIVLIISLFFVSSAQNNKDKVSGEVYEKIKKLDKEKKEEIPVIIRVKEEEGILGVKSIEEAINDIIGELKNKNARKYKDLISVRISEQELIELTKNSNIAEISYSHQVKAFLQDSVPIVNASEVWPIQISGVNVTGIDETICIIDTGMDFSHPDLTGKNKTCIIDCFNKNCVENCSVGDDNGHGTHVAGIAAANGGINGVAIDTGLIGVKVLNSGGTGSDSAELDVSNAIYWCVENKEIHNISVISMSLGTDTLYSNYCDSTFSSTWTKAINNATANNISVIVATGNDGSTTQISSPACITNSTAVGSIRKDDLTLDYNRNSLTDLIAPGYSINSTSSKCLNGCSCSGSYMICSGTSMATPHVAGVFALISQFFKLDRGRVASPAEIESSLNSTGKIIYDSSSELNFSRIDSLTAIYSLDSSAPNVGLISPSNNTISGDTNQTFSCNITDNLQLQNMTFEIWNNLGEIYYNSSNETSGDFSEFEFNVSLSEGSYEWNCIAYDKGGNGAYADSNFSLYVGNISVTLSSPANNTFTNQNQTDFTCSSQTASIYEIVNISFFIWNSTDLMDSYYLYISGNSNSTIFQYNFTEENAYLWNCIAYNNETESSANENYTITYDASSPIISGVGSSVSTTSATITWTTNENTNSSIEYGTSESLGSSSSSSSLTTSHSTTLSGLSSSTVYYYNISVCDPAVNCATNGSFSFTTSTPETPVSPGGGGGASTISAAVYNLTAKQAASGYTQGLKEYDKIKFVFFDRESIQHTLTVDKIGDNFVKLTILSEPIKLTLGIGQSAKLNLTSPDYYDLYIKLNSIAYNNATLTIQTINEKISQAPITGRATEGTGDEDKEITAMTGDLKADKTDKIKNILIVVLMIIILFLIFIIMLKKVYKKKKAEKHITKYRENFKSLIMPNKQLHKKEK